MFLLDTKTELENMVKDSVVTDSSGGSSSPTSDLCTVKLYKSDGSTQILDYDWSIASVTTFSEEETFIPYIYFKCEEGKRYRIEYCFNSWEGYSNKPIIYEWGKDGVSGMWDYSYNGETIHRGSFSQVLAGPDGLIKICPGIDGTTLSSSTAKLHMEKYVLKKGFTIEIYE